MNWFMSKKKEPAEIDYSDLSDVSTAGSTGHMPDEHVDWYFMRCKRCAKKFKTHDKATAHVCPFCGLDQKKGK